MMYKALHNKVKIEQHELYKRTGGWTSEGSRIK